ncbi:CRISPR-associated endoribonuclease Cas6 [Sediminitomix flava]|uniref:CRISPR-associated endoribonuclease Cas6 n=1 Tax=Sediminitomix flava TaxID=379075 RepID=A0A315ZZZ7_SEDFL|nr:CRISPR-associated endoribonuclease Cas6 [Sediminitomix flava]PWJ42967.1 CRISPR-associated endoribonuclease Cas6 [Sediminitomix flava]
MRIRVIFSLKNKGAVLPFHHQKLIGSLIKDVLGNEYPEDEVLYSYSGLKGQTKVGREGLHYFSKRVTIVFTALSEDFLQLLIKKFFSQPYWTLGNLILLPERVEKEGVPSFSEAVKFLCISPLVILDTPSNTRNKEFIYPTLDEFSDYLYESTMHRMERSGKFTAEEISSFYRFQIVPDKGYLERIARQEKKFARIYTLIIDGSIKEVRGYTFPFELYADPRVQEFIFTCGFGELTHKGFGMLDVPESLSTEREVIYEDKNIDS